MAIIAVKRIDNGSTLAAMSMLNTLAVARVGLRNVFSPIESTAETMHWIQVTNSGASRFIVSLLRSALFTNTVRIDVNLRMNGETGMRIRKN